LTYNHHIRVRPKKPKISSFEKEEKQIAIILSLIKANGMITESTIRHTLKLSYTKSYQLISDIRHNHQDVVSYSKETRMLSWIPEPEVKNEL